MECRPGRSGGTAWLPRGFESPGTSFVGKRQVFVSPIAGPRRGRPNCWFDARIAVGASAGSRNWYSPRFWSWEAHLLDFMRELLTVDAARETANFGNVQLLLDHIREWSLYPYIFTLESGVNEPECVADGADFLMFGANNYLSMSEDPRVKDAAIRAIEEFRRRSRRVAADERERDPDRGGGAAHRRSHRHGGLSDLPHRLHGQRDGVPDGDEPLRGWASLPQARRGHIRR